jgi:hypothetical protein
MQIVPVALKWLRQSVCFSALSQFSSNCKPKCLLKFLLCFEHYRSVALQILSSNPRKRRLSEIQSKHACIAVHHQWTCMCISCMYLKIHVCIACVCMYFILTYIQHMHNAYRAHIPPTPPLMHMYMYLYHSKLTHFRTYIQIHTDSYNRYRYTQ